MSMTICHHRYFCRQHPFTSLKLLADLLQLKEIDLLKGEQKTPEYEEINPNKTVPALTHGDTKVWFLNVSVS